MKTSYWLTILLGMVVFTGCGTTAANTIEVSTGGNKAVLRTPNAALQSDVEIMEAKSSYINEIMEVVVTLQSHADELVRIEYKSEWFDRDGIIMSTSKRLWDPDVINAQEKKQVKVLAPANGAVQCLFSVRYVGDGDG